MPGPCLGSQRGAAEWVREIALSCAAWARVIYTEISGAKILLPCVNLANSYVLNLKFVIRVKEFRDTSMTEPCNASARRCESMRLHGAQVTCKEICRSPPCSP